MSQGQPAPRAHITPIRCETCEKPPECVLWDSGERIGLFCEMCGWREVHARNRPPATLFTR